jgi:hypothetical protein
VNKQKIVEIIKEPNLIKHEEVRYLEQLADSYPYSQFIKAILAKGHVNIKSPQKQSKISCAAIYTSNRSVLKNFMEGTLPSPFRHIEDQKEEQAVQDSFYASESAKVNEENYTEVRSEISTASVIIPDSQVFEQERITYTSDVDNKEEEKEEVFNEIHANLERLRRQREGNEIENENELESEINSTYTADNYSDSSPQSTPSESEISGSSHAEDEPITAHIEHNQEEEDKDDVFSEIQANLERLRKQREMEDTEFDNSSSEDNETSESSTNNSILQEQEQQEIAVDSESAETDSEELEEKVETDINATASDTTGSPAYEEKSVDEQDDEEPEVKYDSNDPDDEIYLEIRANLERLRKQREDSFSEEEEKKNDSQPEVKEIEQTSEENINIYLPEEEEDKLIEELKSIDLVEEKEEQKPIIERQKEQIEIINRFIQANPRLSRLDGNTPDNGDQEDLTDKYAELGNQLVSENLAIIMVKQNKIDKAIDIYKKLIWKFPQKKAYFAQKIEELKQS